MSKRRRISAKFQAFNDFARDDRERRAHEAASPLRRAKPIIEGQRRNALVDRVLTFMRNWKITAFEAEGTVRHGLRSQLCMAGFDWHRADSEAASLVSECLRRLGAVRPSWEEGQLPYTVSRDYCAWCHGPIPDDLNLGQRSHTYCSDVCARSAIVHRELRVKGDTATAYATARELIRRASAPAISCEECATEFRPADKHQVYCCEPCGNAATARKLRRNLDRPCERCRRVFRPWKKDQRFCSRACHYATGTQFSEERTCACCSRPFVARNPKGLYCSPACNNLVSAFRTGNRKPREITPRVFDYLLVSQGLRITEACVTDRLFEAA